MPKKFDYEEALNAILEQHPDIRFRRFHIYKSEDDTSKEYGGAVVAFKKINNTKIMAFSFKSPKDKYIEAKGRFIAASRLIHKDAMARGHLHKVNIATYGATETTTASERVRQVICGIIIEKHIYWAMNSPFIV